MYSSFYINCAYFVIAVCARSASLTPLLAAINPVVAASSDTAGYIWLKSNATADVQVTVLGAPCHALPQERPAGDLRVPVCDSHVLACLPSEWPCTCL